MQSSCTLFYVSRKKDIYATNLIRIVARFLLGEGIPSVCGELRRHGCQSQSFSQTTSDKGAPMTTDYAFLHSCGGTAVVYTFSVW